MTASLNPYKTTIVDGNYTFRTDAGRHYTCSFFRSEINLNPIVGVWDISVFLFSFYPEKKINEKLECDVRVSATIIHLLSEFFINNPNGVIGYICQSTDKKEVARHKLFEFWHLKYGKDYTLRPYILKTPNNIYGGVLTRADFGPIDVLQNEVLDKVGEIMSEKYDSL